MKEATNAADARRKAAEQRLVRSRPARESASAAHALRIAVTAQQEIDKTVALSTKEEKILDAASEILAKKGHRGKSLARSIDRFRNANAARTKDAERATISRPADHRS